MDEVSRSCSAITATDTQDQWTVVLGDGSFWTFANPLVRATATVTLGANEGPSGGVRGFRGFRGVFLATSREMSE